MTVAACPNSETLAAFARGDLPADELAAVAGHVGECDACCRALKLVPEDSLANLARAAAAPPTVNSSGAAAPNSATNHSSGPPASISPNRIPVGFVDHPRYRIVGELGAGGMGTVYKAEDQWMGRTIAVKVVSPHLTAKASAVARFRKEIQAAAQLHHQNIIMAHDTGEAGGCQFLVMEFIEGVSLDKLVARKGPLPVPMACMFARQAALGLQHAAGKGMVHRDIKPQNLMVTRKGQVKILDFGLARFASTEEEESAPNGRVPFGAGKPADAGVTNPNLLMGTPDYLSPEQAKNSHDVDPRSDIYSLGCTLYFLLTGRPPFSGSTTLIDKLLAHTEGEPPPVREARFDVTDELAAVLARMMAKRPEDRYQTAAEAAAALLPHTRSDSPRGQEPVAEVIEAVVVNPVPKPAPVRAEAAEDSAFDTDADRASATLAEAPRPKRSKKPRKKALPWWQRHLGKLIGGGIAGLLLVVALAVAANVGKKPADKSVDPDANAKNTHPGTLPTSPPPKGEKDDKAGKPKDAWTPPTVIAPPKDGPKILYVLPSDGVWLHDYTEARKRLEERGATVVTASFAGGSSPAHPDLPGPAVPIDVKLTAAVDLSDYSAVVFAGANVDEYMPPGRGSGAAGAVIKRTQTSGKVVAAICLGQGVLAAHGALKNRTVADCDPLRRKFPLLTGRASGITWDRPGVTTDGKLVTASGGRESREFADAILKAVGGK